MKNEKSTFSVLFYLKKDKMKKNGLVPIHARITINGKQTQFNTKLEVLETNWKSGRAIGKSMEIQRLNSMLDYKRQNDLLEFPKSFCDVFILVNVKRNVRFE